MNEKVKEMFDIADEIIGEYTVHQNLSQYQIFEVSFSSELVDVKYECDNGGYDGNLRIPCEVFFGDWLQWLKNEIEHDVKVEADIAKFKLEMEVYEKNRVHLRAEQLRIEEEIGADKAYKYMEWDGVTL